MVSCMVMIVFSLDLVISTMHSKELKNSSGDWSRGNSEGLVAHGRSKKRSKWYENRNKSKSNDKFIIRCYHYKKKGHIMKNYFLRKNKKVGNDSTFVSQGYKSSEVLAVTSKWWFLDSRKLEWFLDSGCSFHMSPHRHLFFY